MPRFISLTVLLARARSIAVHSNRRVLIMAALVLTCSSLGFASTVADGMCTNLAFYSSIQLAINSVPAGSTIKVCPGTYQDQILITKSLTLVGESGNGNSGATAAGTNNPVIEPPASGLATNASDLFDGSGIAAQTAIVTPSGAAHPIVVNISNLTVDGSNNLVSGCGPDLVGIYYQNASGTVNHVVARNTELGSGLGGCQSGLAIYAESGYGSGGTSAITIENSSVHNFQKNGITVDGSGTVATVLGNYVVGQGATPVIAQNGIQVSDGANGKVTNNTVTDDVYVNPSDCSTTTPPSCCSASGILLYDSGGSMASGLTISGNVVSNTQGGIVLVADSSGTADYNTLTSNKVTTTLAAGPYLLDGIDLCGSHNTANMNNVFNSSGSGIHIDSSCTESDGQSGNDTTLTTNTINEACAGVLTGNGTGNSVSGTLTFNVGETSSAGDSCPGTGASAMRIAVKLKPSPKRP
jgi:parallel beta-helix repeat protein